MRIVLALIAVAVPSALVTTSQAAFTSTTGNDGNSFATGSVDLVDDDLGSSMFALPAMYPGQTIAECIVVTYNGDLDPTVVRVYSGGFADSGSVADDLNVTVDEGTGGASGDCSGFAEADVGAEFSGTLSQFDALHTDYASGFGEWDPSGAGQFATYRITLELDAATPAAEQGESVSALAFTWETQS